MEQGGNAVDAAAAMCFCLNLLEPTDCGIGGEVPTLVYSAADRTTYAISGMGWSPEAFTVEWCRANGIDLIPGDGFLPACVPAVVGTWALALARFGTMSFSEVLQPAIELARDGFAMYERLHNHLQRDVPLFLARYPTTAELYCPEGRVPEVGEVFRNPDFAAVLELMCEAERKAARGGRVAGIEAAVAVFYQGPIAERIAGFISSNPVVDAGGEAHIGLLDYDDMADWEATIEEPLAIEYQGLQVHKCPPWTQGPTFLQHLRILDGFDLVRMGHNTAEYLHTWVESAKLAFADREAYYGDPRFDDVPFDVLLSEEYADKRRDLIGDGASLVMRPGDVGGGVPAYAVGDVVGDNRRSLGVPGGEIGNLELGQAHTGDTTHLDAVDREGNMVAATPSGGWVGSSPVIGGLGFPLGTRGQMFYLNPDRPNALEPRKRPRATLTPTIVTRAGEPYLAFGTPGGDSQEQWTLQFFLNYVHFGMDLQEALDAPTVHTEHFPSSFYPRERFLGRLSIEADMAPDVVRDLERRGHHVEITPRWTHGKVMGIRFDSQQEVIHGAVAPKGGIGYAMGW